MSSILIVASKPLSRIIPAQGFFVPAVGSGVHRVTVGQEAKAWSWLRRRDEREYSFVDATSFEVMRQRRLREALAFDQEFSAAGFIEIRP